MTREAGQKLPAYAPSKKYWRCGETSPKLVVRHVHDKRRRAIIAKIRKRLRLPAILAVLAVSAILAIQRGA
jgi:hypothetical protein